MSYIITSILSFAAGVIATLLFARRNKNKIAAVNKVVDRAASHL